MSRSQTFNIIVGGQKSGKTHMANEIIQAYPKKALVIDNGSGEEIWDYLPEYELNDIRNMSNEKGKIMYDEFNKDFFLVFKNNFRNGLLIFDDGNYFMNNSKNERLIKMISIRRQLNIDIIFICHGLTEIAPRFWTFADRITLFPTTDNLKRKSGVIPEVEKWEKIRAYANYLTQLHKEKELAAGTPEDKIYCKPIVIDRKSI